VSQATDLEVRCTSQ